MEEWIRKAIKIDAAGNFEDALDIIYNNVDDMMIADDLKTVDKILSDLDTNDLSEDLLTAFLTLTQIESKDRLPSRPDFYNRAYKTFESRTGFDNDMIEFLRLLK